MFLYNIYTIIKKYIGNTATGIIVFNAFEIFFLKVVKITNYKNLM